MTYEQSALTGHERFEGVPAFEIGPGRYSEAGGKFEVARGGSYIASTSFLNFIGVGSWKILPENFGDEGL